MSAMVAGVNLTGRGVILERVQTPSTAVCDLPAVFAMKSTSSSAPGTGAVGNGSSFFGPQWTFAILEPSGNGLPLPGMPAWYASNIRDPPRSPRPPVSPGHAELSCDAQRGRGLLTRPR